MVLRKPYSGQRKMVLAFDIGTTHSGVSYCILRPGQIPEMRGITRFPGQKASSSDVKVPSILYYDGGGNVKAAGNQAQGVDVIETAVDEEWTRAEWWKLRLCPRYLYSADMMEGKIPPLPRGKSAVDVMSDFIKYLFACAKTFIEEQHLGFNWPSIEDSVEFVFTYSNNEGVQQQQYRSAIERAGLVPGTPEGRSRVHLLRESEASLNYFVSTLYEQPANAEPQGIVIIDAGGGSINLSTYLVTSHPASCNEIVPAESRLQGSAFVSRCVTDLLKCKLQGSPHCTVEELDAITREFDQNTKLTISSADQPVYLRIGTPRYNDPQYNIKRGALKLSGDELASLFDELINTIIDLFERQRQAAKMKISIGFLVGGFGANGLLWDRLRSHFEDQGIKLSRPENDINKAVANGALLSRIFPDDLLVENQIASATYGTPHYVFVDEDNPEHLRRKSKWEMHHSGRYRIPGAFDPILCKGDQIDERQEICRPFSTTRRDQASFADHQVRIMCYQGAITNPGWLDEDPSSFVELCTIRVDLRKTAKYLVAPEAQSGEAYYQAHYNLIVVFGDTGLDAHIAWWTNGIEERAPATIVYNNL